MFGKKLRKKITFAMLVYFALPVKCSHSLNLHKKIEQLEGIKQNLINKKISKKNDIYNQRNIQYRLGKSISGLETEITLIVGSINQLEQEIETYDIQIDEIEREKEEKEKLVAEKKKVLGKCFRLIYTHKVPNAYELLFQTSSFEDFIDKSKMSQLVINEFFRIADVITAEKAKINDDLKKINNLKNSAQIKLDEIDDNKKLLEKRKKELEKSYENSKNLELKAKKEIDDNDADVRRVDREVEMYKQKIRAQEESRQNTATNKLYKGNKKRYNRVTQKINVPTITAGTLLWPVPGCNRITSNFYDKTGRRSQHNALDITASTPGAIMGEPILAPADMLITYSGWCGGYGNHVRGEFTLNDQTYEVRFGHLCSICPSTKIGTRVSAGTVIGYVGNTGYSFGAHLHFEIRKNSVPIDPASFSYSGRYKSKSN